MLYGIHTILLSHVACMQLMEILDLGTYPRASSGEFFHGDITVLVYTVLHIAGFAGFGITGGGGGVR